MEISDEESTNPCASNAETAQTEEEQKSSIDLHTSRGNHREVDCSESGSEDLDIYSLLERGVDEEHELALRRAALLSLQSKVQAKLAAASSATNMGQVECVDDESELEQELKRIIRRKEAKQPDEEIDREEGECSEPEEPKRAAQLAELDLLIQNERKRATAARNSESSSSSQSRSPSPRALQRSAARWLRMNRLSSSDSDRSDAPNVQSTLNTSRRRPLLGKRVRLATRDAFEQMRARKEAEMRVAQLTDRLAEAERKLAAQNSSPNVPQPIVDMQLPSDAGLCANSTALLLPRFLLQSGLAPPLVHLVSTPYVPVVSTPVTKLPDCDSPLVHNQPKAPAVATATETRGERKSLADTTVTQKVKQTPTRSNATIGASRQVTPMKRTLSGTDAVQVRRTRFSVVRTNRNLPAQRPFVSRVTPPSQSFKARFATTISSAQSKIDDKRFVVNLESSESDEEVDKECKMARLQHPERLLNPTCELSVAKEKRDPDIAHAADSLVPFGAEIESAASVHSESQKDFLEAKRRLGVEQKEHEKLRGLIKAHRVLQSQTHLRIEKWEQKLAVSCRLNRIVASVLL